MQNTRYEVIPSVCHRNKRTGQRVSLYGAVPWQSDAQAQEWEREVRGWTIHDHATGTIGCGRPPWATREEAQAMVDRWNNPNS